MRSALLVILSLALAPALAAAKDQPAANTCAGALGADAKRIYDAVAPSVKSDSVIKEIIVEKVRPLVMAGTISRSAAQAAAPQAGECLRLLK